MAKIKITLDTRSSSQGKDGKYPLVLRIGQILTSISKKVNLILIPLKLMPKEELAIFSRNSYFHREITT